MASTFAAAGEESKDYPMVSPRTIKRSWSSNSSCSVHQEGTAAPKCVCAPATHARSFKCRLHRVNSQGPSPPSPRLPSQPASSAPSNRIVEAQ